MGIALVINSEMVALDPAVLEDHMGDAVLHMVNW